MMAVKKQRVLRGGKNIIFRGWGGGEINIIFELKYRPLSKGGRDSKKSVEWSDTDVILSEESIDKAIVSLQIPEVLNDEAIQVILWKKFWIGKAIVSFQTPEFLKVKWYRYIHAKKF